jgi:hypothetical protein
MRHTRQMEPHIENLLADLQLNKIPKQERLGFFKDPKFFPILEKCGVWKTCPGMTFNKLPVYNAQSKIVRYDIILTRQDKDEEAVWLKKIPTMTQDEKVQMIDSCIDKGTWVFNHQTTMMNRNALIINKLLMNRMLKRILGCFWDCPITEMKIGVATTNSTDPCNSENPTAEESLLAHIPTYSSFNRYTKKDGWHLVIGIASFTHEDLTEHELEQYKNHDNLGRDYETMFNPALIDVVKESEGHFPEIGGDDAGGGRKPSQKSKHKGNVSLVYLAIRFDTNRTFY